MSKILLVDDDAPGLEIRKLILERAGHQVAVASSAEKARELYRETPPDTAILDLRLPHAEDGRALIRDLRRDLPNAQIVVVSGWTGDLDGHAEGDLVNAIFPKPVACERLLSAIKN